MYIERTNKEIIIRLSSNWNTEDVQEFIDFLRYKELTSKIKVPQKAIDKLADSINKKWWTKNRSRFTK